MGKNLKRILAIILSIGIIATFCAVPLTVSADPAPANSLRFDGGAFKIVVFSDVQDQFPVYPRVINMMEQALNRESPDLVVFLGDITEQNIKDPDVDLRRTLNQVLGPVVDAGIPYAFVFGNHDDQSYYSGTRTDKEAMLAVYQSIGDCRTVDADPSLYGTGTCKIPIYSENSDDVAFNLFMVDSNTYQDPLDGNSGYDNPHADQVAWLAANDDTGVNSIVFQHIPMPEIYNLLEEGSTGTTKTYGGKTYVKQLNSNASGTLGEFPCPCPAANNHGEFTTLQSMSGVLGVFTGHDHLNDFTGTYGGINMTAVPGMTYFNYGDEATRGYGVIELDESDLSTYSYDTVKFSELDAAAGDPGPTTYDDYDEITYYDLKENGNALSSETAITGGKVFTYTATSPSKSAVLKFRWTVGSATGLQFSFDNPSSGISYPFGVWVKKPSESGPDGAWHLNPVKENLKVPMGAPLSEGDIHDIELGRLKVTGGSPLHVGQYYVYLKVDGALVQSCYVNTAENGDYLVSGDLVSMTNEVKIANWTANNGNKISPTPEPEYYDYDEVYYSNLYVGGTPVAAERSGSGTAYTYNKTSPYGSAVLKMRYRPAGTETEGQISFDKRGSNNAINYMFGVQIYKPGADGYSNGSVWLRPGYGPRVELPEPIVAGNNYDIEFARLKVRFGPNKGKYYMYFKFNGVLLAEDYVAANVVDSSGNYTSNPSSTACSVSNEIYITFWGGGGATITNPAYTETYEEYDTVNYSDLYVGGTPVEAERSGQGTVYTYNKTSASGSAVLKYRWKAANSATQFQMSFDKKGSENAVNFMFGMQLYLTTSDANYPNGYIWLRPGYGPKAQLPEPIVTGNNYDIEFARLKVATGPKKGKYYMYFKLNGVQLAEDYIDANVVDGSGNYTSNPGSTACSISNEIYITFWGGGGATITGQPEANIYDTYDDVYYSKLFVGGNAVPAERTGQGTLYTYNKTSSSGSAILRLRWKAANAATQFQMSFDKKGSENAINYMFGMQLYTPTTEYPNGSVALRPGYGPKAQLPEPIVTGNNYDIEFARLKVNDGPNGCAGKYYMYVKLNGVLLAEDYVAANVVDSSGNYTSNPGNTACAISNEMYITFWGGGGATITNPDYTETYDVYDEVYYSDLTLEGQSSPLSNTNPNGYTLKNTGKYFTYTGTSPSHSAVVKYRWTIGDNAKMWMSFDRKGDSGHTVEYMFSAIINADGELLFRPQSGGYTTAVPADLFATFTTGTVHDVEFARLKVLTGPENGGYYVYLMIDGNLLADGYVPANVVDASGNYTSDPSSTACTLSDMITLNCYDGSETTGQKISDYPETLEEYDTVNYSDLYVGGTPVEAERSGQGTVYTYNKTSASGSAVLKYRWKAANSATQFQMSFDKKGSENAINYMFGMQLYLTTSDANYPNGYIWLRPGYGPKAQLPEPIVTGNNYDIEFARIKVANGPNRGKYYMYFKLNGTTLAEDYVAANVVDSSGNYTSNSTACSISNEIYITFWGGGGATITGQPEVNVYEDYDEVYYSNLYVNGNAVPAERSGSSTAYTYNKTSASGSAILRLRWKAANSATQFQMSFDKKGSENAINYMFGMQLYTPTTEYPNGYIWLRPGYGPKAQLPEPIVTGNNYDIEFARLKVADGPNGNAGKYYVYFKLNGVQLAADYVDADVVDSSGNYTSNPGNTACSVSNEIYITFWGGGGATITNPAYTETYDDYDEVTYYDMKESGTALPEAGIDLGTDRKISYTVTSASHSAVVKFRWTAGSTARFAFYFDAWAGSAYPFCFVVKNPGYSGLGTAAGANGAWDVDPSEDQKTGLDNMNAPISAGDVFDIEFARLKVLTGPEHGNYYVYLKVNGELIRGYYYDGVAADGSSYKNGTGTFTEYLRLNTSEAGNIMSPIPIPVTYEEYDEIGYEDLYLGGNPVPAGGRNLSGATVFNYNQVAPTGSAVFKYRWKVGSVQKFQLSFEKTSASAMAYQFGAWLSEPGADAGFDNGRMWLVPGSGPQIDMPSVLESGSFHNVEFGRLMVKTGAPSKVGKYYVYIKIDDTVIAETYVAGSIVDENGDYTTNPGSTTCNVKAGEIFFAFWGSDNNAIAPYKPTFVGQVGITGDIDGDDYLDTRDLTAMINVLLGETAVSELADPGIADFNKNGSVSVSDLVAMKRYFAPVNTYSKSGSLTLGMQEHLLESDGTFVDNTKTAAYIADASATLGSGAYRLSRPIHALYDVTSTNGVTVDTSNMTQFKGMIAALKAQGINEILYVTDSFLLPYGYSNPATNHNKTCPTPGTEDYENWLTVNAAAFGALAAECPEIKFFEPFNEINLTTTGFEKPGIPWDASAQVAANYKYTVQQKAGIMADLCWYISRAVKAVNYENQVTTPSVCVGSHESAIEGTYLNALYSAINSGAYPSFKNTGDKRADNYFTIVNIHAYPEFTTGDSAQNTKINNIASDIGNTIYSVMQAHKDGGSRVWLTETGVSVYGSRTESSAASFITKLLNKVNSNLTYIDTIIFYKVADASPSTNFSEPEKKFGLFYAGDASSNRYGAKQTAKAVYSFFHNGTTNYSALTALAARYA